MHRRQPRYKRTATLFPYTPRFRSRSVGGGQRVHDGGPQRLGVRHAAFAGSETRVVRQIRPSDGPAQDRILARRRRGDQQETVAGREYVRRGTAGLAAVALQDGLKAAGLGTMSEIGRVSQWERGW